MAAQSNRSFLRIGELVPDLSKAAESAVVGARAQIESFTKDSIAATKESLSDLRADTFQKVGAGFLVGFIAAVAFAIWIFPLLRGIDIESRDRIMEIAAERNAELTERIETMQNSLNEMRASISNQNGDDSEVQGDVQ
ncbi:MAG: hypothetical protein R3284_11425 [Rubricoccaceae bacterium]|nr:hypothetical protein [Rubricoccaceae bacterium]